MTLNIKSRLAIFIVFLSLSCQKAPQKVDAIYIAQSAITPEVKLKLDGSIGTTTITAESSKPVSEDVNVTFSIDNSLIDEYNRKMSSNYVLYPADQYSITNNGNVKITKGMVTSDNLTITVNNWSGYDDAKKYMIPIVMTQATGAQPILTQSNTAYIIIDKTIQTPAVVGNIEIPKMNLANDALNEFTVEGRFNFINATNFVGQVDWSTTICTPFNLQFLIFSQNAREGDKIMAIRFPDASFLMTSVLIDVKKWYHFAITYSAGNIKLYLDGILIGSKTVTGLQNSSYTLGYANRMAFSEYRVWSKALTQSHIQQNVCITDANNPDLLAYWRFNQLDTEPGSTITINQFTDLTKNKLITKPNGTVSFTNIKCPE
jgi:hypothetical protein